MRWADMTEFERRFWCAVCNDAEGTIRRVKSLRDDLQTNITADKILSRYYPGSATLAGAIKGNEDMVALIDRLLADYDSLDEVPF